MQRSKRILMIFIALLLVVSSLGAGAAPAPAQASCRAWHTVRHGQTLSGIAAYYGVHWPYLAQVNNVRPPRYTIFTGQVLCIPTGGYWGPGGNWGTGGYPAYGGRVWSFAITNVVLNTSVTINTARMPNNVLMNARMGMLTGGGYTWVDLPAFETGAGGAFTATFAIPAAFSGAGQLVLRLIQQKKNGRTFTQDQVFYNANWGAGGTGGIPGPGYYPVYYWGVPRIWIVSVVRDNTVTIQTQNFPAGVTFDVMMGVMGTRGVGGYHVGTLNSGSGGVQTATFPIPVQLRGLRQISIRAQSWSTGYFSYNWFWNNTAF